MTTPIPHVVIDTKIRAPEQNALIDRVNLHTEQIENLSVPGGDLTVVQGLIDGSLDAHIQDEAPHPAYEDLPSLTILFENGLV